MRSLRIMLPIFAIGAVLAVAPLAAQEGTPHPREVWAAQPVQETPYKAPNRLIWRVADILAAHKRQQSWMQRVLLTRDFAGDYVSMAPGEKTKTMFYADDRVFWWVQSGQMKVTIETQEPFMATKGFLVDVAPRLVYSVENTGNEPVVFFRITPAGEIPSYPISETPTPAKGWKYIRAKISDTGAYDTVNRPYLDFNKDVVAANGESSSFVLDGHTSAHIIRGPGVSTPPSSDFGHFHENMVEAWCVLEGRLDVLVSGEKLVTGDVGDIIMAPNERWHRATSHPGGPSTRLAITPRLKEGQVHYFQPDAKN